MTHLEMLFLIFAEEFRGFQVRKHIRPLLQSKTVKWDETTADFMRQYCKKWRAKSIYQVLLFYRAARHQDLVYFSQQVHLFNQSAVSGVNSSNRQSVPLDKVDPGGRSSLALGKMRPSVMKLHFRLQDLTYFDTTYMCDPLMTPGAGTSNVDDDLEAWDAPLRRNNLPLRTTLSFNVRDQECQTGALLGPHDGREDNRDNFTHTPFCRDPNNKEMGKRNDPVKVLPKNAPYQHGPQPYAGRKATGVHAVNYPQDKVSHGRATSAVPSCGQSRDTRRDNNWSNVDDHDKWDFPRSPSPKSNQHRAKNEYNRQGLVGPEKKRDVRGPKNPILEMESKGRQKPSEQGVNDEPPFNFQAMLRKTNNNRASLRRNQNIDTNSSEKEVTSPISNIDKNMNRVHEKVTMKPQNSNSMQTSKIDSPAAQKSPREEKVDNFSGRKLLRRLSAGLMSVDQKIGGTQPWSSEGNKREVTTELAPGIMIQGQVSDL